MYFRFQYNHSLLMIARPKMFRIHYIDTSRQVALKMELQLSTP